MEILENLGKRIYHWNKNAFFIYRILVGLSVLGLVIGIFTGIMFLMVLAGEQLINYIFIGVISIIILVVLLAWSHDVGKDIVG